MSPELEKKLELQKKEIETLNNEIDNLAYIISHDLQAPLRGIVGFTNILEKKLADKISQDNERALFENITECTNEMRALINGVLRFSRATRNKGDLLSANASSVLKNVVSKLAVPSKINIDISQELPILKISENHLEQIFTELIENSIYYMGEDGGNIIIRHFESIDEHQIVVKDDGPGIDPKFHKKIFKLFRTGGNKTTQEHPGVGLTIAQQIMQRQGGEIWVESNLGQGTEIHFTIKK